MKKAICFLLVLAPAMSFADQTVNLQWSICDSSPEAVLQKMGASDTSKSKTEVITYYDTQPPVFDSQGISFRTKGTNQDSVVKVRFDQEPANTPAGADCLWERYGNQEKYVCEIDQDLPGNQSSPWSADQLNFVDQYKRVDPATLIAFGPYDNPKWKVKLGSGLKGTFDTVETPGQHLMELEIKLDKSEDDSTYDQVTSVLNSAGVILCPVQEGKTTRLFKAMGLYR